MAVKFGSFTLSAGTNTINDVGFSPQLVFLLHGNHGSDEPIPIPDLSHCFSVLTNAPYVTGTPPYPSVATIEEFVTASTYADFRIDFETSEPSFPIVTEQSLAFTGSSGTGLSHTFDSNGFSFSWDGPSGVLVYYLAVDEAESYLSPYFNIDGSKTTVGFEPNALLMWSRASNIGVGLRCHSSFGIATTTSKQYCLSNAIDADAKNNYTQVHSDRVLQMYTGLDDPADCTLQVTSFDSDGITLNAPSFYADSNYGFAFLAVRFNLVDCGLFTVPSSWPIDIPTTIHPEGLLIAGNNFPVDIRQDAYYASGISFVGTDLNGVSLFDLDYNTSAHNPTSSTDSTTHLPIPANVTQFNDNSFTLNTKASPASGGAFIFLAIGSEDSTPFRIRNDMEMPPLAYHYMAVPHRTSGVTRSQWTVLLYKDGELITDTPVDVIENPANNYTFFFQNDGSHESVWNLSVYQTSSPNLKYTESWIVKKRIVEQNVKYLRSRFDSEGGFFKGSEGSDA